MKTNDLTGTIFECMAEEVCVKSFSYNSIKKGDKILITDIFDNGLSCFAVLNPTPDFIRNYNAGLTNKIACECIIILKEDVYENFSIYIKE